jgi:hypothetical protein
MGYDASRLPVPLAQETRFMLRTLMVENGQRTYRSLPAGAALTAELAFVPFGESPESILDIAAWLSSGRLSEGAGLPEAPLRVPWRPEALMPHTRSGAVLRWQPPGGPAGMHQLHYVWSYAGDPSTSWCAYDAPWRAVYGPDAGPDPVCRQDLATGVWASTCGMGSGDTWTPVSDWPRSCFDGTAGYRHQLAPVMGYPQDYAEIPAISLSAAQVAPANWSWQPGAIDGTVVNAQAATLSWTWEPAGFVPAEMAVELLTPCASGLCVSRRFEPARTGNTATWPVSAWGLELGMGKYTARLVLNGSYGGHRVESEGVEVYDQTVEMVTPAGDPVTAPVQEGDGQNEYVFSADAPGVLTMHLRARVASASLAATIQPRCRFSVDPIGESQQTWHADHADGIPTVEGDMLEALVDFTGLPASNEDFGRKEAVLDCGEFGLSRAVYEVFFPKLATNHPYSTGAQPDTPNWFYYWSQVVGAVDTVYGGTGDMGDYILSGLAIAPSCWDYSGVRSSESLCSGYSLPRYKGHIAMYDPSAAQNQPLDGALKDGRKWSETTGIDTFADIYRHELQHVIQENRADAKVGLVPDSPWRFGWSWFQGANHNHWMIGPDGQPGVGINGVGQPVDDDGDGVANNLRTDGPGELGAAGSDDVALGSSEWEDWPVDFPLPRAPWIQDNPFEDEAYNAAFYVEGMLLDQDWGSPGKQHKSANYAD